jgi:hypothetical protein
MVRHLRPPLGCAPVDPEVTPARLLRPAEFEFKALQPDHQRAILSRRFDT